MSSIASIKVSPAFKQMAIRAIFAIVAFIIIYVLLILFAMGLVVACALAGLAIVSAKVAFYTILAGLGLLSGGLIVLIFLFKFIFKKHKTDYSHLLEIREADQPELFALIKEVVNKVQTSFPHKVYLSADVNAAVFYNSNFWSMFLPVKKNLQIGVGLMNAVTVTEFKAILGHEFGHFSQRTMKVGSYVYNVNQIIYNMLYDNTGYDNFIRRWADLHAIIAIFVMGAVKVMVAIQWILKKAYNLLNISYMSLSREMEFHADEVAAHVAGPSALSSSLLRLNLADYSLNEVLGYYNQRCKEGIIPRNIFPQHQYALHYLAKESQIPNKNGLPEVSLDHINFYNRSKINIRDQWASHPTVQERISALNKLNIDDPQHDSSLAITLLKSSEDIATKLTDILFKSEDYAKGSKYIDSETFIEDFNKEKEQYTYDAVYSGYYDNKKAFLISVHEEFKPEYLEINKEQFFSPEKIDLVYSYNGIIADLDTLKSLYNEQHDIKTFDYDGVKYKIQDCQKLMDVLEKEKFELEDKLFHNDQLIYNYCFAGALQLGRQDEYVSLYKLFLEQDKKLIQHQELYVKILNESSFIHYSLPFEIIGENINKLKALEPLLKGSILLILEEEVYRPFLTRDIKDDLQKYVEKDHIYFHVNEYDEAALTLFFAALSGFFEVQSKTYYQIKRNFLDLQAGFLK